MLGDYSVFGEVRFELEYFMPHFAVRSYLESSSDTR